MSEDRREPMTDNTRARASERCRIHAGQVEECTWLLDPESERFVFVSSAAAAQRGLTPEDVESQSFSDALAPESLVMVRQLLSERISRYRAGDRSPSCIHSRIVVRQPCRSGPDRDFEWTTVLVDHEETGKLEWVCITRDITDRRHLEEELTRVQIRMDDLRATVQQLEIERLNMANDLAAKNRLLGEIVIRDEMTGLYNRQLITQRAQEEIDRANRYGTALSMLIFDLDDFKRLQETWGYEAGDRILIRIANTVAAHIRKPDILSRWGNESFAILMPHTTVESGQRSAERMRRVINDMPYPDVGPVTASFGVAERGKGETYITWFRNIDRALQEARNMGGNQVRSHLGLPTGDPVALVRFAWRPDWESGNRQIDRQHRELLEMANDLMDMALVSANIDSVYRGMQNLLAHIQHHFWDEERILSKLSWPRLDHHAQCHVDLLDEAARFEERLLTGEIKSSSVFAFITETIISGHLLKEDAMYFDVTRAASPDLTAD